VTSSSESAIRELLAVQDSVNETDGPEPRVGSPAQQEISEFSRPLSVKTAYAYGSMALALARDHLEAVDLIIRLGQPSLAQWTSLRGLLEAASIASWQLDVGIDAYERVSRNFALRFTSMTQSRKIAVARGELTEASRLDQRMNEMENIALSLGYPLVRNKHGKRDGIGQRKPNITELAESQYDFSIIYKFISSIAHCDSDVVAKLGFENVGKATDGQPIVQRSIDLEELNAILANALMLYMKPFWLLTVQFGFNQQTTSAALEQACDEYGVSEDANVRIWRAYE